MEGIIADLGIGATAGAVLTIVGRVFTMIKENTQASHERQMELIRLNVETNRAADESADAAAQRVSIDAGKWVRRFIICSIVFSIIIVPFLAGFFPSIPIAVDRTIETGGWLWGLFPASVSTVVEYIHGFYSPGEIKTAFMAVIGFYFGRSATK